MQLRHLQLRLSHLGIELQRFAEGSDGLVDVVPARIDRAQQILRLSGSGIRCDHPLHQCERVVGNKGRVALVMLTILGLLIAMFALSKSVVLSCIVLFLAGIALIAVFTLIQSLVQLITDQITWTALDELSRNRPLKKSSPRSAMNPASTKPIEISL